MKDLKEFVEFTRQTAVYPKEVGVCYTTLGLCGEAGEVAEIVKKAMRTSSKIGIAEIRNELGDVLWYWCRLADELGLEPLDIIETNIAKLEERYG